MTSLRIAPLSIATALSLPMLLAGCPGTASTTDDAFVVGADAGAEDAPVATLDAPGADAPSGEDAPSLHDAPAMGDATSASDAPIPTSGAYVADSCGPADGPALQITISDTLDPTSCSADPMRASTSFYLHDLGGATLPPAAGSTFTSTAAASNGSAVQCPGGSPPCRLSETFSITFTRYEIDGGATGQYTITWEGGETSTGNFDAARCESGPVICG
jgi:hypothetical protein